MFALCVAPLTARADTPHCVRETLQATVETDGGLAFVDQRVYDLTSDTAVLTIILPKAAHQSDVEVQSVRSVPCDAGGNPTGEWTALERVPFQLTWRDGATPDGALDAPRYGFDESRNTVYVFLPAGGGLRAFVLDGRAVDAVELFEDVAQLNWTMAPADGGAVENLAATIALPVPGIDAGAAPAPLSDVHAWGHGPADSTVEVLPSGVVECRAPAIASGAYFETRVLFPESWLTSADAELRGEHVGQLMLDTALAQEESWSDQWRVRRDIGTVSSLTLLVLSVIVLGATLICYLLFGREYRRRYESVDVWPVPAEGLSPVVVNRLLRWGHPGRGDVALSVGRLLAEGVVRVARAEDDPGSCGRTQNDPGSCGRTHSDPGSFGNARRTNDPGSAGPVQRDRGSYTSANDPGSCGGTRLVCTAQTLTASAEPVETATLALLFEDLVAVAPAEEEYSAGGLLQVDVAQLEAAVANRDGAPAEVRAALARWEAAVAASFRAADYFESRGKTLGVVFGVVAGAWLGVSIVFWGLTGQWLAACGGIVAAVCTGMLAARMPRRTPVGDAIVGRYYELVKSFQRFIRQGGEMPPPALLPYAALAGLITPTLRRIAATPDPGSSGLGGGARAYDPGLSSGARVHDPGSDGRVRKSVEPLAAFYSITTGGQSLADRLTALFDEVRRKS